MSIEPSSLAIRRATVAAAARLAILRHRFRSELGAATEAARQKRAPPMFAS